MAETAAAVVRRDPWDEFCPEWRRAPTFKPWVSRRVPWEQCSEKQRAALRLLWKAGDLSYMLDPEQRRVYGEVRDWISARQDGKAMGRNYMLDMCRRFGKSSVMMLIAFEERIRRPDRRIAYWTATGKMAEEIIVPEVLPWLTMDCPPEMCPEWFPSKNRIIWRGDNAKLSKCRSIELVGLDNPDAMRGRALYMGIVDEGAFVNNLEYILASVVGKQMLGVKNERGIPCSFLLLGSTPPVSPAHYWTAQLKGRCRAEDAYLTRTIFDVPRLSNHEIREEIRESGGPHHSTTRRELYAEHVVDESSAVIPEANEAVKLGTLFLVATKPKWRNCYTAMDPGWSDATGVVFGYVDFSRQRVVVEGEWKQVRATSATVADAIKDMEMNLWHDVPRWSKRQGGIRDTNPHRRWTDVDKRLVADLASDHDLMFQVTEKSDLAQQIVRVRNWVQDGTLEVDKTRCPELVEQLQFATYANELRRKFARVGDFEHFDLLAALVYLCRNVEPLMRLNPNHPRYYGVDMSGKFQPEGIHARGWEREEGEQVPRGPGAVGKRQQERVERLRSGQRARQARRQQAGVRPGGVRNGSR